MVASAASAPTSHGSFTKGGVLDMIANGASSMCERPINSDIILSQLSAIPGCVEYASLLDSFVENGTYSNSNVDREDSTSLSTDDREDSTSLCKLAGPMDLHNWKGGACLIDTSSPQPDICRNIAYGGPCCFVSLDLRVQGGN